MKARAVFNIGATMGIIKYMSGYNHFERRNKMINREAISTQCPRYIDKEDWEHILLCIVNKDCNEEFIY